jgi:hypothetical protein
MSRAQYFAFYDGGDNAGCYHRVTDGWPISRLDASAIGGSWDAPTRALVLFQVRPPRIRPWASGRRPWHRDRRCLAHWAAGRWLVVHARITHRLCSAIGNGVMLLNQASPFPQLQIKEGHYVAYAKSPSEVVGRTIASNIATFAAAQAQVRFLSSCVCLGVVLCSITRGDKPFLADAAPSAPLTLSRPRPLTLHAVQGGPQLRRPDLRRGHQVAHVCGREVGGRHQQVPRRWRSNRPLGAPALRPGAGGRPRAQRVSSCASALPGVRPRIAFLSCVGFLVLPHRIQFLVCTAYKAPHCTKASRSGRRGLRGTP